MDKKQEIVYGILTGELLLDFLIRGTKKDAIKAFIDWNGIYSNWKKARNSGYSIKKFRLQEIAKKSNKS